MKRQFFQSCLFTFTLHHVTSHVALKNEKQASPVRSWREPTYRTSFLVCSSLFAASVEVTATMDRVIWMHRAYPCLHFIVGLSMPSHTYAAGRARANFSDYSYMTRLSHPLHAYNWQYRSANCQKDLSLLRTPYPAARNYSNLILPDHVSKHLVPCIPSK